MWCTKYNFYTVVYFDKYYIILDYKLLLQLLSVELKKHSNIVPKDIIRACQSSLKADDTENICLTMTEPETENTYPKTSNKCVLFGYLFKWLNLPSRDREESTYQVAYDQNNIIETKFQDPFPKANSFFAIPCIQKLTKTVRKELVNCSIGLWEFTQKVICGLIFVIIKTERIFSFKQINTLLPLK